MAKIIHITGDIEAQWGAANLADAWKEVLHYLIEEHDFNEDEMESLEDLKGTESEALFEWGMGYCRITVKDLTPVEKPLPEGKTLVDTAVLLELRRLALVTLNNTVKGGRDFSHPRQIINAVNLLLDVPDNANLGRCSCTQVYDAVIPIAGKMTCQLCGKLHS
jgi:hypothetical protein